MMERFDCKVTNKEKRKLSSLGLAIISITSHWKSILVSVLSLSLSGLLFVLAATYTASIAPESIVKKMSTSMDNLWLILLVNTVRKFRN